MSPEHFLYDHFLTYFIKISLRRGCALRSQSVPKVALKNGIRELCSPNFYALLVQNDGSDNSMTWKSEVKQILVRVAKKKTEHVIKGCHILVVDCQGRFPYFHYFFSIKFL